jgi:hypothetical protein
MEEMFAEVEAVEAHLSSLGNVQLDASVVRCVDVTFGSDSLATGAGSRAAVGRRRLMLRRTHSDFVAWCRPLAVKAYNTA